MIEIPTDLRPRLVPSTEQQDLQSQHNSVSSTREYHERMKQDTEASKQHFEREKALIRLFKAQRFLTNHITDQKILHYVSQQSWGSALGSVFLSIQRVKASVCTDQRDKIYGLLGIFDPSLSRQIKADYSLPPERVFLDFNITGIRWMGLNFINEMPGYLIGCTDENWPSWAADLHSNERKSEPSLAEGGSPFGAGGEQASTCRFSVETKSIICQALLIGKTMPSCVMHDNLFRIRDRLNRVLIWDNQTRLANGKKEVLSFKSDMSQASIAALEAGYDKISEFLDRNSDFTINGRKLEDMFVLQSDDNQL